MGDIYKSGGSKGQKYKHKSKAEQFRDNIAGLEAPKPVLNTALGTLKLLEHSESNSLIHKSTRMRRGKHLSDKEKVLILAYSHGAMSPEEILEELGRSTTVACDFLRLKDRYEKRFLLGMSARNGNTDNRLIIKEANTSSMDRK